MIKKTLCFSNPAYLSMSQAQLVIKLPDVEKNKELVASMLGRTATMIPIEDIGVVIIDHKQITITSGLIEKLHEHNVAIVYCGSNHMPTGLSLAFENNHTYTEKLRKQLNATEPLKKQLWKQTISNKIQNQAAVLKQLGYNHKPLLKLADNVTSGDPENMEGQAAAKYWQLLLAPYQTTRGQHEGGPNLLLNYGYAIIRAVIARNLVGSGCLPAVGIHHRNKYNAYCLADDIMEPYRPIVDLAIFTYLQDKTMVIDEITTEHKKHLLKLPAIDIKIEGKTSPLMVGAQRTTASLVKCFEGTARKILYPIIE
jgi:CRISPR-associated protein Cas1